MTKPTISSASAPRLCPTCGTRVGAAATKCVVCGTDLTLKGGAHPGRRPRRAEGAPLRLPHPLVLALILLLIVAAAGYWFISSRPALPGLAAQPSQSPTAPATETAPPTPTATSTATETPEPTATPLPPVEYVVVQSDTCTKIAASYGVSAASIIELNQLDPNCTLSVGKTLLIPQPTPNPTPLPSATLGANVATQVPRITYTVHPGDTLQAIANFYGVTVADIMEVNGISDATSIRPDQVLIIPTERQSTPGPTPTATEPPEWPAPNLLLPSDGQHFAAAEQTVTLQWASVGTLRPNEYYYVVVEDVTCACARFLREATTETKFIVPATFRPEDDSVHSYRWTVSTVRQRSEAGGQPQYDPAGATSPSRIFSWVGGPIPAP